MKRFAGSRTPIQSVSRLISRHACTRACIRASGSRAIAALAAAATLFAAQLSIGFERGASADTPRSLSTASTVVALHAAPTHHVASESRSSARWPSNGDVLLPTRANHLVPRSMPRGVAIVADAGRAALSVAGRGYDATAPPASS